MLFNMNISLLLLNLLLVFYSSQAECCLLHSGFENGTKVIIDHDGGADDAMAIFLTLLHEETTQDFDVIGITTVNGNVNEGQCFVNTQRILDIAERRDIPIYRGSTRALVTTIETDAHFGYDGLGDNNYTFFETIEPQSDHAAVALVKYAQEYSGQLVVLALGPLTNIALAIRLDPKFIRRLAQLVVGAGNIYSDEADKPEFNAKMDPEAYRIMAENAEKDKVTVVPFSQIKQSLNNTAEWRTNVLGTIPTRAMQALNSFERISLNKSTSWHPLDPAVTAVFLNESIANEVKYSKNDIILEGDERGLITNDFQSNKPNVKLIYSFNLEIFKLLLINLFNKTY